MIDLFPTVAPHRGLIADDFKRFSKSYAEILKRLLPTVQEISFIDEPRLFNELQKNAELSPQTLIDLQEQTKEGRNVKKYSKGILLSFIVKDTTPVLAHCTQSDPLFLAKVSEDWLNDIRLNAEREFLLLKEARIDVQTGLLNLYNLYSLFDSSNRTFGLRLILIELPPKRLSYRYASRYSQKCASLIQNFIQGDAAIHAIGHCTYAVVMPEESIVEISDLHRAIVAYLKREGCNRIHIGSSCCAAVDETSRATRSGAEILNEAWTALRYAEARGPFSFCDYERLIHPERHPLAMPSNVLMLKLRKLWRNTQRFSLVFFHCYKEAETIQNILVPRLDGRTSFITEKSEIVVYCPDTHASKVVSWAHDIIAEIEKIGSGGIVIAGICSYPFYHYSKSEVAHNCRKALLHATYLGQSGVVSFDAVSLNVSGDIYFGDGDLAKAVREYRTGLRIDPQSINLHNSLGVALAMMGRLTDAMSCFHKALSLEATNFMAHYNLGLAEIELGNSMPAYEYFENALKNFNSADAEIGLAQELKLQLGILAAELGKPLKAIEYLTTWYADNETSPRAGRVWFYLGKAYYEIASNIEAIIAFQKALQFNEYDDRAMCLLGILYFHEGQGADIAYALCHKSVELEPGNLEYRCSLAELQISLKRFAEARDNLSRCLRNKKVKVKALFLLGRLYECQGRHKNAVGYFVKALQHAELDSDFVKEAKIAVDMQEKHKNN